MNNIQKVGVMSSVVMIAVGILLLCFRAKVAGWIAVLIGLVVFVSGIIRILSGWMSDELPAKKPKIFAGIVLACMGGILMLNSGVTVRIAGICIGVFAFMAGMDRFQAALILFRGRKNGMEGIGAEHALGSALLHIVFAVLMCTVPAYSVSLLVMVLGIYCIASGIMMLISHLKY